MKMILFVMIYISEIQREPHRWIPTWNGYREIEKYGNRHAKFIDNEWLDDHWDEFNATSFPKGTIEHLAHWGNEKTGVNENLLRLVGWGTLAYVGLKFLQKIK